MSTRSSASQAWQVYACASRRPIATGIGLSAPSLRRTNLATPSPVTHSAELSCGEKEAWRRTALPARSIAVGALPFSHAQMQSVQSGAPCSTSSALESAEKPRQTRSVDSTSAGGCGSARRRRRLCTSWTETLGRSPGVADASPTATTLRLGATASATTPSEPSEHGTNRCARPSAAWITRLWPAEKRTVCSSR